MTWFSILYGILVQLRWKVLPALLEICIMQSWTIQQLCLIFFMSEAVGVSSRKNSTYISHQKASPPYLQRRQNCSWAKALVAEHSSARSDHPKRSTSSSPTRKPGQHWMTSLQHALVLTRGMAKACLLSDSHLPPSLALNSCCEEVHSCHHRTTSWLVL